MLLTTATTVASALLAKHAIKMICQPRKTTEHYSTQNAQEPPYKELMRSAILSQLAYADPVNFRASISRVCGTRRTKEAIADVIPANDTEIHFYDAFIKTRGLEDTQAYMWRIGGEVFLSFRGTEDKNDAMADIDVRTYRLAIDSKLPCMRVHNGFYEQTDAIIDDIIADFNEYDSNATVNCITIQGHSLGSGCASIAALMFAHKYPGLTIKLHTFGSPRVGDSQFAKLVADSVTQHWRVYNVADPVPMIPMSFRFKHIGANALCLAEEAHNMSHEVYTRDAHWTIRPLISFGCINLLSPVSAHDCEGYIKKLESLCE